MFHHISGFGNEPAEKLIIVEVAANFSEQSIVFHYRTWGGEIDHRKIMYIQRML